VIWRQEYLLFGRGLIVSAVIAGGPIYVILLLLGVLRKPAWLAGLAGLATAALIAIVGYRMPVGLAASASAFGAGFGVFPIAWIVFWAIVLFRITVDTGGFEIIRNSIGHLTADARLQVLLIAFGFGAFMEGAAGFGTPVAIAAAMLVGLGFTPFRASAACLLANIAPGAFGAIGIPIVTLAGITDLPVASLSATVGRLCAPVNALIPVYILVAMGGWGALSGAWLAALIAGAVFAAVQFVVAVYLGPQLADLLASISAMLAVVAIARVKSTYSVEGQRKILGADSDPPAQSSLPGEHSAVLGWRPMLQAWLPYCLLVICILTWSMKPVQAFLDHGAVLFSWPYLHNAILRMPPIVAAPTPYAAKFNLNVLSASGTGCMVAALLAAVFARMSPREFCSLLGSVVRQLSRPTLTFASVLAAAFLMNYSGATSTLGLAFAGTGKSFPFFSAALGWLGAFLTGSDTSSNALFGNLQIITAGKLGISSLLMAATNATGGMTGKMISLQTIAVAAAATGMSTADQARLFRFALRHSLLLAAVVGGLALFYTYSLHFN
jgi:lactate permease